MCIPILSNRLMDTFALDQLDRLRVQLSRREDRLVVGEFVRCAGASSGPIGPTQSSAPAGAAGDKIFSDALRLDVASCPA
jgi:hypothetical protein